MKKCIVKVNIACINQDTGDEEEGIEGDGKWYVYLSLCQLGGCDFNGVPFETEREAFEEAVFLTLQGKEPNFHACPSCYREYLKDCI